MAVRKKYQVLIGLSAAAVVLGGVYYWLNPTEGSVAPKCIFHSVTGLSCPGCGMQRFLHAFLHGNFVEAFHYNYLLLVLIPYLVLLGIENFLLTGETKMSWKRVVEGRVVAISMCIIAPSWFVIRNILHI